MAHQAPAVVIGANLAALGIVRSLARGGVPTFVVDTSHRLPAMRSKFSHPVIVPKLKGPELVEALVGLAARLGSRPVLFVAEELSVTTISAFREELEAKFQFRLPSEEMISRLADKALFHELAEQNGLPVPRSVILPAQEHFHALETLSYPVVIKPCNKMRVCEGQTDRIRVACSPDSAVAICRQMLASAGSLLVQEWIEGPDSNIYFCLFYRGGSGQIVKSFAGRKFSCYPPHVGSTAICGAAQDHRADLERMTYAFAERVSFDGMGSIEYKWDLARHRFFVIEPTVGRADWQEEIATVCGCNIPLAAYCHELQLPVPQDQPANLLWRELAARRVPHDVRHKCSSIVDGYWRADDPRPAVFHYSGSLPRLFRDRFRRAPALSPAPHAQASVAGSGDVHLA